MSNNSTHKVVLVTGCTTGGIGFHLCEEFAEKGCLVYATSRRLETMQGFQHDTIRTMALDVTKDEDITTVVQKILEEQGKIDIVVNNAGALAIGTYRYRCLCILPLGRALEECIIDGMHEPGPVAEATIEQVRNAFELNTFAALRVTNAIVPSMIKRREGLIINIGSIAGIVTTPWNALYCAAKAALHSITEGLSMELKPFGIKVMLVAPGGVKSNISANQALTFKLPPTSHYVEYEERLIERMNLAAHKDSMPTDAFAREVVANALASCPPPYLSLGWSTWKVYISQWLPRQYVLGQMYNAMVWKNKSGRCIDPQ
ncbi:oxidoreductase [Pisolithus marmoratus]|nr:oxidoreductase [Pisolithus marmoratus]